MKLVAVTGLTYGTRHLQPGEPFKASDMDGAVLLAKGQARVAPAGITRATVPAKAPEPTPEQSPRRGRRRGGAANG